MRIRKLKWGNSIFSRLVVTFLLIMIPIYMLGIFIYYWGVYTVKSEISKSTTAQVSFYLESLEKEIERIKILQYDCLNDEYLNNLAIKYEILDYYDIKESMRQLQQRLVTIKNSSVYIKNVSAHILNVQKTISSNNGVDSIDMERYREIRVPVGLKGAQIISYKNRFFLSTLQQKYVNPVCLIEVELNQDASTDAANTAQADEKDPFGKYDPAIDISFVRTIDDDTSSNILPKTPGETMEDNQGSPEGII